MISHPHFYTTYAEWAHAFGCPVYISAEDEKWLDRTDAQDVERRVIHGGTETIVEGVTAVKAGGHFDGSLVLHWDEKLFIADTLLTVQVGAILGNFAKNVCLPSWVGGLVGILPRQPSSRNHILRFHVVDPELHTAASR